MWGDGVRGNAFSHTVMYDDVVRNEVLSQPQDGSVMEGGKLSAQSAEDAPETPKMILQRRKRDFFALEVCL